MNENHARQVFEIYLVHDSGVGRHDRQIAEGCLAPAQKCIALFVALKFEERVHIDGVLGPELIDLNGVIDH